jgi:CRISPR-associated protein Cst1
LLSSIIAHDYDRFKEILLQLSVYAGVEFGFAFDLFDDFEENKDVAYTFINTLGMRAAEAQKD